VGAVASWMGSDCLNMGVAFFYRRVSLNVGVKVLTYLRKND
jgi:hypothetical protein